MNSENSQFQFQINKHGDSSTSNSSRQNSIVADDDLSTIPQEEIDKFLPKEFPELIKSTESSESNEAVQDYKIPLRRQIFNDKKILKQVLTKPKKGIYMCNHCDQIFYTFGELLDHFDQFDVKRPHKCSFVDCPWKIVGFNRVRQLNRHESSVHSIDKDFKCHIPNCNKEFGRVDLLNRHLKSVHENKNSRFNRKLSKDHSLHHHQQQAHHHQVHNQVHHGNSPTGSISSIDEMYQFHDHSTTSPIIPNILPSQYSQSLPSSSSSLIDQRKDSKYKHTIEFLTNDSNQDQSNQSSQ